MQKWRGGWSVPCLLPSMYDYFFFAELINIYFLWMCSKNSLMFTCEVFYLCLFRFLENFLEFDSCEKELFLCCSSAKFIAALRTKIWENLEKNYFDKVFHIRVTRAYQLVVFGDGVVIDNDSCVHRILLCGHRVFLFLELDRAETISFSGWSWLRDCLPFKWVHRCECDVKKVINVVKKG